MARPTHHRSRWRIRPVDHTGRRLCLTYDTLEEAEQALAEIERGKRALQEGRVEAAPAARTFQELAC